MKPLYDQYRLIKQILCRASAIPVIVSSVFPTFFLLSLSIVSLCPISVSPFTGEIFQVGVHIQQECPILLLEGHYPSEFSSSLNQTHLNRPGLQDYLKTSMQVFWDSLEPNSAGHWPSRSRTEHPWFTVPIPVFQNLVRYMRFQCWRLLQKIIMQLYYPAF